MVSPFASNFRLELIGSAVMKSSGQISNGMVMNQVIWWFLFPLCFAIFCKSD